MPYERAVLIAFAYAGYLLVGFACVFVWWVGKRALSAVLATWLVFLTAMIVSLVWADGIAHVGKALILGPCNPFVAACNGEHEGWTGPTTSDHLELWNAMKCGPPVGGSANPTMPWLGNPGSGSFCK